jgi:ribosomal protein S26
LILLYVDNFRCDICSEDIPIHQKIQHKSMHKTEREFEKGLEKGKVQKTKRQDVEKTGKKTGYLLFCSVTRPVLKQSHNPSAKQMMSLLGIE